MGTESESEMQVDELAPYWWSAEQISENHRQWAAAVAPTPLFVKSDSAVLNTIMSVVYGGTPPADVAACALGRSTGAVLEARRAHALALFAVTGVFDDIRRLEEIRSPSDKTTPRMAERWPTREPGALAQFIAVCRDVMADQNVIRYVQAADRAYFMPLTHGHGTVLRAAFKTAVAAVTLLGDADSLKSPQPWEDEEGDHEEYFSPRVSREAVRVANLASSVIVARLAWRVGNKYRAGLGDDLAERLAAQVARLD